MCRFARSLRDIHRAVFLVSGLRVCEFISGGFGSWNERLCPTSPLAAKVIGKRVIPGCPRLPARAVTGSLISIQFQPVNAAQRNRLWVTAMSRAMLVTLVTPRTVKRCIPYFIRN